MATLKIQEGTLVGSTTANITKLPEFIFVLCYDLFELCLSSFMVNCLLGLGPLPYILDDKICLIKVCSG